MSSKTKTSVNIFFRVIVLLACFALFSCAGANRHVSIESTDTVATPKPIEPTPQFEPAVKPEKKQVIASWYGPGFHGKPTASGEIFDQDGLTCAHRELPFGTILAVTNLKNNKEAHCIVNDRGPFVEGRDLDLSWGTAKSIGLLSTGPVLMEIKGRDMKYVKYIKYGVSGAVLTIQTGSFKDEENARRLKTALELAYKDVYIMPATIAGERYYRVRLGKFSSREEAQKVAGRLANEGYDTLITKYEVTQ